MQLIKTNMNTGVDKMLKNKDRAALRAMANGMPAIFRLGKEGVTPEFTNAVRDALEARELIKIDVLNNCEWDVTQAATTISERTNSHIVQIIGKKFVLYRKSLKKKEGVL